ncbi:MAG: P-loop NTPase, partial [Cyanobacteria bacterium J06588_5]
MLGGTPSQINLSESDLLTEGQLSEIDLSLVADLVRAQVRLQSLAARQTGLDQAIQKLRAELNEFPNLIAEYNRLQPDVETQRQSLERLLALRQELSNELAQGGFSWDIVEAPKPGEKIGPQPKQNILLGAVAGLFVGGALAFCREAIDRVVRTSDELEKQTALPLLGVIPEMPGGKIRVLPAMPEVGHSPANVFPMSQWQPFRDAVDLIYKTIQLTNAQPLSSLMITSALAGEGKTILAVGLALSAARSHQRVLLVDANFRRPSLHKYFGLSNEHGLSTQLRPSVTQIDRIQVSPVPLSLPDTQIHVLPAGPVPEDPVRLLSSLQIRRFLKKAEAIYDLVIMDAPAILGLVDGLQLASLCKASIIVSRLDHITQDDLNNAISMLSKINTIGIVANGHQGGERAEKAYEHNGYSEVLSER